MFCKNNIEEEKSVQKVFLLFSKTFYVGKSLKDKKNDSNLLKNWLVTKKLLKISGYKKQKWKKIGILEERPTKSDIQKDFITFEGFPTS